MLTDKTQNNAKKSDSKRFQNENLRRGMGINGCVRGSGWEVDACRGRRDACRGGGGLGQVVFEVEGVVLPQLSSRSCLRIYLCPYPDLYHEVRMDCE
jgi:hypothetical protein